MKLMLQIGIVFGICLIGEAIALVLPIPFPSSIISMILLLILLIAKIIKTEHIEKKADFLLKNMAFFFIPTGVGIMDYFGYLKDYIFEIFIICIISTVLTFAATAYTIIGIMALQRKIRGEQPNE